MPSFQERARCAAPAESVWRLLHDPRRFAEWWADTERVETGGEHPTRYVAGWPDFPMPMALDTRADGARVVISCLVSDVRFEWTLEPEPSGCAVQVTAELPEHEAARLGALRAEVGASLERLVARAEGGARGA